MKVKQLIDTVRKDWAVILFCFIVAVLIYVFHQSSLSEKRTFVIPLEVVENGNFMVTGTHKGEVTVSITSTPENMSTVHTSLLKAYLNLNTISQNGDYDVPVTVEIADELLGYDPFEITVRPESIKVHVEKKDVKYLPVTVELVGEPAFGYEISEFSVEPQFVRVEGPETVMKDLEYVGLEQVIVEGMRQSTRLEVLPLPVNKILSTNMPEIFLVDVKTKPVETETLFENLPVQINNLQPQISVVSNLPKSWVLLKGNLVNLNNYVPSRSTLTVDMRDVTKPGIYDLPVKYNFPASYEIVDKGYDSIRIEVEEVPVIKVIKEVEKIVVEKEIEVLDKEENKSDLKNESDLYTESKLADTKNDEISEDKDFSSIYETDDDSEVETE